MKSVSAQKLQKDIITPDYCSGCGICTANGAFKMELNKHGQYGPVLQSGHENQKVICPFASHGLSEDDLAAEQYQNDEVKHHDELGFYRNLYAGYVAEGAFRKKGSSGGSITWLTQKLLQEKAVDYVIHVVENQQVFIRFSYHISSKPQENIKASKSKYYPVTLEESLQFIKQHEGKYAIVGLPCFIKGINLLKLDEPLFAGRIKFTISLFCGHLKSTHYLSSLLAQFQVKENEVKHFDFRHKIPQKKASDYNTKIVLQNGEIKSIPNSKLFGTNWGWGLFKLKACDYCDDIVGETADISFGDAWIPPYENDYSGTNIIITRDAYLDRLIHENMANGNLNYEAISPQQVIDSQSGGYRHRREGLAYRLYLQQKKGIKTPVKRVKPEKIKSKKRRKLYEIRMQLQEKSFYSEHYRDIEQLKKELMPLIRRLEKVYEHSAWTKFRLKLKKWLKK